uniref:Uncharacterized protein n=1 Tax=Triticum urartu TaxID=4572 RepID=A0A8R7QQJ7_TRIUA
MFLDYTPDMSRKHKHLVSSVSRKHA